MSATPVRSGPGQRIVVIDDTVELREVLRLALPLGGFEVVGEAGDGVAGIDVVRAQRPDIVLLDMAMPVMDGLEALPMIRQLCPRATIVVFSAFGSDAMAERAMAGGADGYLQKGAPIAVLLRHIRDLARVEDAS